MLAKLPWLLPHELSTLGSEWQQASEGRWTRSRASPTAPLRVVVGAAPLRVAVGVDRSTGAVESTAGSTSVPTGAVWGDIGAMRGEITAELAAESAAGLAKIPLRLERATGKWTDGGGGRFESEAPCIRGEMLSVYAISAARSSSYCSAGTRWPCNCTQRPRLRGWYQC